MTVKCLSCKKRLRCDVPIVILPIDLMGTWLAPLVHERCWAAYLDYQALGGASVKPEFYTVTDQMRETAQLYLASFRVSCKRHKRSLHYAVALENLRYQRA